jgi:chromosomal replication initiator protein
MHESDILNTIQPEHWKESISFLETELDPQIFAAYIKPLKPTSYNKESCELTVSAPSNFVCNHVNANYKQRLSRTLAERLGVQELQIRFAVDKNTGAVSTSTNSSPYVVVKKVKQTPAQPGQSADGTTPALNPRYTFSSFVVGNNNQFCHAAAQRVAEAPGQNYNPLFIYGGVGLGKTHLLHAIGNMVLASNPSAQVVYMSSETFTNELIQSLRFGKMDEFKNRLRNINVLLIDDIQFMCGKERTQEEFFHTFNALYASKNQIVITSDKLPQEIPGIEERLRTRFSWGLTADLQAPDFETRVAILKRKAIQEEFGLPEDVAHYIAENIVSNVRELEGALTRLHAMSSIQNTPITAELARSSLKHLLQPKAVTITIDDIKGAVATHFSIKVSDMVSKRRTRNLSFPRHIAMYLCRKHTTASYPEIGSNFGGRDHSSVIHAANVVASKVKVDSEIAALVQEIERRLLEP